MTEQEQREIDFWDTPLKQSSCLFKQMQTHGDINYFLMLIYYYAKTVAWIKQGSFTVVELGCGTGISTSAFAQAVVDINTILGKDATLTSIDILPQEEKLKGIIEETRCQQYFTYIQNDDMEVVKTWTKPIDVLFIDTSHKYEHTIAELNEWGPLVVNGGIVLLHDTRSDYNGVSKPIMEYVTKRVGQLEYYEVPLITGLGIIKVLE